MPGSFPVLLYHQIVDGEPADVHAVSAARFAEQMRWLSNHGYCTVRPDEEPAPHQAGRPIAITFDDGYRDNYVNAVPILASLGFTATFFVVAERVGGSNDWDRGGAFGAPLTNWREIEELAAAGFQIGSHGCTHAIMTEMDPAGLEREMRVSKALIEAKTGMRVHVLSYPYSRHDQGVEAAAAAAGYRCACTYLTGYCGEAGSDRFAMRRTAILADDSAEDFTGKVRATLKWRGRWYRRVAGRTWIYGRFRRLVRLQNTGKPSG